MKLEFEDAAGNRLDIRADKLKNGMWRTRIVCRRGRRTSHGETNDFKNEKSARREMNRLEEAVKAAGWQVRVVVVESERMPAPMLLDPDGKRKFIDARTGEAIEDLSCLRPLTTLQGTEKPHVLLAKKPRATGFTSLPQPVN